MSFPSVLHLCFLSISQEFILPMFFLFASPSCLFVSCLIFKLYGCFLKFCVLESICVLIIGKHFYRTGKFWKGDAGLTMLFVVWGCVPSVSDLDREYWGRREDKQIRVGLVFERSLS